MKSLFPMMTSFIAGTVLFAGTVQVLQTDGTSSTQDWDVVVTVYGPNPTDGGMLASAQTAVGAAGSYEYTFPAGSGPTPGRLRKRTPPPMFGCCSSAMLSRGSTSCLSSTRPGSRCRPTAG